ncbi:hypothetical protein E2C01_034336 [Portunus trituberculatus]|uniref:Uncharacterized protein n=1 Tax=Portunus trituberculatus TaxID=210409 RepID=A0A5B7F5G3_PORTR|nr:hypothetical protein [Portunus trituberculatus]
MPCSEDRVAPQRLPALGRCDVRPSRVEGGGARGRQNKALITGADQFPCVRCRADDRVIETQYNQSLVTTVISSRAPKWTQWGLQGASVCRSSSEKGAYPGVLSAEVEAGGGATLGVQVLPAAPTTAHLSPQFSAVPPLPASVRQVVSPVCGSGSHISVSQQHQLVCPGRARTAARRPLSNALDACICVSGNNAFRNNDSNCVWYNR